MKAQVIRNFKDRIKFVPGTTNPLPRKVFEIIDEPEERISELLMGGYVRLIPVTEEEVAEIISDTIKGTDPMAIEMIIKQYLVDHPLNVDLTPYLTIEQANMSLKNIEEEVASIPRIDPNSVASKEDLSKAEQAINDLQQPGVNVSSEKTMTVDIIKPTQIFTGTTSTWTWPGLDEGKGKPIYVKNLGTGNLTIKSNTGTNDFYYRTAINNLVIEPGNAFILINNGNYWTVN